MTPTVIDVPAVRMAIGIAAAAKGARPAVVLIAERVSDEPEVWRVDLAVERQPATPSDAAFVPIQVVGRYAGGEDSARDHAENELLDYGLAFDGHVLAGDH